MKQLIQILFVVSVFWHSNAVAGSLPLAPAALPVGWQRVEIPEVGTIDIPPSMEVQSGKYAQLNQALKKSLLEDSASATGGKITIQQKGLNAFDPTATKSYVRVMVETDVGTAAEFENLNSRFEVTAAELREIATLFRTQLENQSNRILEWDVPCVELVNGMQAFRLSYRRQNRDNPPVRVTIYVFQNQDRMHRLTMSYRESERSKWLSDFPTILSSFRITNVRGQSTSTTTNPMALLFGGNWVLVLILSGLLTWGIGLAPPLLVRFAFMRRPMPKVGAIAFVAVFCLVNIVIFTALGSESKTHSALFLVAIASYYILRRGAKKQKASGRPPPLPQQGSSSQAG